MAHSERFSNISLGALTQNALRQPCVFISLPVSITVSAHSDLLTLLLIFGLAEQPVVLLPIVSPAARQLCVQLLTQG